MTLTVESLEYLRCFTFLIHQLDASALVRTCERVEESRVGMGTGSLPRHCLGTSHCFCLVLGPRFSSRGVVSGVVIPSPPQDYPSATPPSRVQKG